MVMIDRDRASHALRVMSQIYRDSNHPGKASMIEVAARRVEAIPPIGWHTVCREDEPLEGQKVLGWLNGQYGICRIFDHDYDGEALWDTTFFKSAAPTHWVALMNPPEGDSDD